MTRRGPLFRQYHSSSPEAPYQWIGDYRDYATQYIEAYAEYREVSAKLRAANSIKERKEAVTAAKEVREKILEKGRLATILEETIATIEAGIATQEKEETEKMAAQEIEDAKALDSMRTQTGGFLQQLKFAEARAIATATFVKGEKAKSEQTGLVKWTDALAKFKAALVADINASAAAPYAQTIKRKAGAVVPGSAARANDLGVEVHTPYGNTPLMWTDLSPDTVYNMGRYFIARPGLAADAKAERQWQCGAFAIFAGKKADGRVLLNAAAEAKAEYRSELPLFLEFANAP